MTDKIAEVDLLQETNSTPYRTAEKIKLERKNPKVNYKRKRGVSPGEVLTGTAEALKVDDRMAQVETILWPNGDRVKKRAS